MAQSDKKCEKISNFAPCKKRRMAKLTGMRHHIVTGINDEFTARETQQVHSPSGSKGRRCVPLLQGHIERTRP